MDFLKPEHLDLITEMAINYGPKLLMAIAVLIVGFWLIKRMSSLIGKSFTSKNIEPSLASFVKSILRTVLKILLIISVLGMIGIEMTSFIAIIGAAGLAIGLALSGSLQNFAGGVMILLFKPYVVGDLIEGAGYTGKVKEIRVFNTILKTVDNKTVIIPNSQLANNALTNYTTEPTRRVDFTFGIGYGDDTQKARETLQNLIQAEDRILEEPKAFIGVSELADSSVNFHVKTWVKSDDYWPVYYAMHEKVYNEFNKVGLNIPFPQMDVHVHNQ